MSRNRIMTLALIAGFAASGVAMAQDTPTDTPATPAEQAATPGQGMGAAPAMQGQQGKMQGQKGHMKDHWKKGDRQRGGRGMGAMLGGFDTDGDGMVTQAEAEAGLAALVTQHDTDGDGVLSADEFAAMQATLTRPMVDAQFSMLDANNDGRLDATEAGSRLGRMFSKGPINVGQPGSSAATPATPADPAVPGDAAAPADPAAPATPATPSPAN